MRLPEAQVAHGVPGAIHSLAGVGVPDGLRHDSCNAPRLRRKARRSRFPWQRRRRVREAAEELRARSRIPSAAQRLPARCGPSHGQVPTLRPRAGVPLVTGVTTAHAHPRPTSCILQMRTRRQSRWPFSGRSRNGDGDQPQIP